MKLGVTVRNMGTESTPEMITECAQAADTIGLDSAWVVDHIAIPPDDAEGSGGRYMDPLATLAYLAGITQNIQLGVGVLVLPYRPILPTAKWIATIQELSGERLIFGAGVGWMRPEFKALGLDRKNRGKDTDAMLAFLNECFEQDEVELNGQPFLFKPRPKRPPIFIGGAAPHALRRALRYGDGWLPMALSPAKLAPLATQLKEMGREAGKTMQVISFSGLPLNDASAAEDMIAEYKEAGVDHLVHGMRYTDVKAYREALDVLAGLSR
ncbi:MAG: TIGR03619 family F420-dependent LLM class oxidoreductase [Pseudomonadota bacterium]